MGLHPLVKQGAGAIGAAKLQTCGTPFLGKGGFPSHPRCNRQLSRLILQPISQPADGPLGRLSRPAQD